MNYRGLAICSRPRGSWIRIWCLWRSGNRRGSEGWIEAKLQSTDKPFYKKLTGSASKKLGRFVSHDNVPDTNWNDLAFCSKWQADCSKRDPAVFVSIPKCFQCQNRSTKCLTLNSQGQRQPTNHSKRTPQLNLKNKVAPEEIWGYLLMIHAIDTARVWLAQRDTRGQV